MVGKLVALFTVVLLALFVTGGPMVAEFTASQLCGPFESVEC